jgi:hypothetical protein
MAVYLPEKLRVQIDEADRRRCRYCLTADANSGVRLTHDHILPRRSRWSTSGREGSAPDPSSRTSRILAVLTGE